MPSLDQSRGIRGMALDEQVDGFTREAEFAEVRREGGELQPLPGHRRGDADQLPQRLDDFAPAAAHQRLLELLYEAQGRDFAVHAGRPAGRKRHWGNRIGQSMTQFRVDAPADFKS